MEVLNSSNSSSVVVNEHLQVKNVTAYDIIDNEQVQALFFIVYTTIFVLGIFGNLLVCYVVLRNKAMQTVTNLFIANLALSDIFLCTLAVPFTPLYTFLGRWVFGELICHLVSHAQGISVYISTLTLTSIAIDRYVVIIYPFYPRMKLITCLIIIVCIWLFSVLVTLPYGIFMRLTSTSSKNFCEEDWPSENHRKIFGGLTTLMQFVIPFFVIAFCYIRVSSRLNDRAKSKPGSKSSKKEEADRERKKRTNRMLIAMVGIFLFSWLPLNCINIINDFHEPSVGWRFYYLAFFFAHALAMSSTCYNPFLYAWLNENFRKEFKQVLPCFDTDVVRIPIGNIPNWKTGRTCNGNNETQQESLLPSGVHTTSSALTQRSVMANPRTDGIEVESVMASAVGVMYDPTAETVRLHLISEEGKSQYDLSST
ncbi:prolactin-releasing peptide receptor-like [Agrilus planipennis]|uniref:Prolactin-releasing peptide receptor-like n=1 Tax=Agrilus planipennis TaxID=224129 RepID=A0A1W4XQD5_AGRPL|nr:prolactin-releasing peptide receptor-like [Agrilus planipennis]